MGLEGNSRVAVAVRLDADLELLALLEGHVRDRSWQDWHKRFTTKGTSLICLYPSVVQL